MIILKSLKLTDFLSHSDTLIEFKPNTSMLIDGVSGSGKSSLVDAVLFATYGKGRTDNKSMIKRGSKSAEVSLELFDDENNIAYKIDRKITASKHELKLWEKNDKDYYPTKVTGVKETQEYIEKQILKASYLLFSSSIIIPQNQGDSFVNQTAAKKKDIILEIVSATNYDDYLKKTKEKITSVKENKILLESKISNKKDTINRNQSTVGNIDELKKKEIELGEQNKKIKDEIDLLNGLKDSLMKDIASLDFKKSQMKETDSQVFLIDSKINRNEQEISRLSSINSDDIINKIEELKSVKAELIDLEKIQQEYFDWNTKMTALIRQAPVDHDYDKDIAEINKQLIKAMTEQVESCPKCGEPYPRAAEYKQKRIDELNGGLSQTKETKDKYDQEKARVEKEMSELGEKPLVNASRIVELKGQLVLLDGYQSKLAEANLAKENIDKLNQDVVELFKEKNELLNKKMLLEKELSGSEELYQKEIEVKQQITEREISIQNISRQTSTIRAEIMMIEKSIEDIKRLEEEIKEIKKEYVKAVSDLDALENLKEAFGPSGIKAIMIDMLVPQLEDKVNDILSRLSDFRVKIDTQKSGIGKDVTLEGLFLCVINEFGEEADFNVFSGGEKVKIAMAINEALASVSKISFRCFDESVVSLDSESTQKFMEAIKEIQKTVRQIIVISHIQEIKDMYDDKIRISKINGTSKII